MAKPKKRRTINTDYIPGGVDTPEGYRDSQGRRANNQDWNWSSNWFELTQPEANETVYVATSEGDKLATYSYVNGEMVRTGGPSLEEGTELVYTGNRTESPEKSWYGDEYYFVEVQNPETGETYWVAENWVAGEMPADDGGTGDDEVIITEPPEETDDDDGGGDIPIVPIPGRAQKNRASGQPGNADSLGPVSPNQGINSGSGSAGAEYTVGEPKNTTQAIGTPQPFNTQAYLTEQRLKDPIGNPEMPVVVDRRYDAVENARALLRSIQTSTPSTAQMTQGAATEMRLGAPTGNPSMPVIADGRYNAVEDARALPRTIQMPVAPDQRYNAVEDARSLPRTIQMPTQLAATPTTAAQANVPYSTQGYGSGPLTSVVPEVDSQRSAYNLSIAQGNTPAIINGTLGFSAVPGLPQVTGAAAATPATSTPPPPVRDYTSYMDNRQYLGIPYGNEWGFTSTGPTVADTAAAANAVNVVRPVTTSYVYAGGGQYIPITMPSTPAPVTVASPTAGSTYVKYTPPSTGMSMDTARDPRMNVGAKGSGNVVYTYRTPMGNVVTTQTRPVLFRPSPVYSPLGDAGAGGGMSQRYSSATVRSGRIVDDDNAP